MEKCKDDFVTISESFKEYKHEAGGAPTCCTWLPTDSNQFAIGYSTGHVAFFDYKTGQVSSSVDLESEVVSITAHELQPQVMLAHANGKVTIYDFAQKSTIGTLTPDMPSDCHIQSLSLLNNCLNLLIGLSSGDILLYDLKTLSLTSTISKAHLTKYDESVTCLMAIQSLPGAAKPVPFFVSGGADGMIKMYEHNPYVVKNE